MLGFASPFVLAATVLVGLLVSFYGVLMVNMGQIDKNTEDLKEHPYTVTVAAGRVETLLMQVRTLDDRLAFARTPETVASVETEFAEIDKHIRSQIDVIVQRHRSGAQRAQDLSEKYEAFRTEQRKLAQLSLSGADDEVVSTFLSNSIDPRIDSMLTDNGEIIKRASQSFDTLYYSVAKTRDDTIATATILMAAVLAVLVLSIIVIREKNRQQRDLQANLCHALESAQEANEAKSQFLSNVSHDIRTPLTAIIGLTDIAEDHVDEPDRVAESLAKIKRSSHHLLNLVNDTLDMSKIESGQVDLSLGPIDVRSLVESLGSFIQPQADTKRLAFEVRWHDVDAGTVLGDEMRVSQVLINLLGNAVKYTEPGGLVNFTVEELSREAAARLAARTSDAPQQWRSGDGPVRAFRFIVEDNGIGMTASFVERIFEPFEREDGRGRDAVEGTGLGMSIAKNLVDLMGGTISVSSERGRGSRFTLELPFEACDDGEDETKSPDRTSDEGAKPSPVTDDERVDESSGKDWSHVRVLLAEDNPIVGEIAEEFIRETGAVVDRAWDGLEVFELLRAPSDEQYDIVFMDVQMPRMDGLQAARAIAKEYEQCGSARPPIVAMTANAYAEDRQRAFDAGMDGYAVKPIGKREFCRLFETYVGPKGDDRR